MSQGLPCYNGCIHRRNIPGDCHVACAKPDPTMRGVNYGILSGWFFYPFNFDPIWGASECHNYEKVLNKEKD